MEISPGVTVDPTVHHGAPVVAGTRVPVSLVVGSLAGGMTKEQVMEEYTLTKKQVEAALAYAASLVAETEVLPLAGV